MGRCDPFLAARPLVTSGVSRSHRIRASDVPAAATCNYSVFSVSSRWIWIDPAPIESISAPVCFGQPLRPGCRLCQLARAMEPDKAKSGRPPRRRRKKKSDRKDGRKDDRKDGRKGGRGPRRGRSGREANAKSTSTVLDAESSIDTTKAADAPLSDIELREIREHFRFIARHRKVLRLKVNATEDLLLNGARDPEHRGVCIHLLGKIDRACINAALTRIDDAGKRTQILEGVVRFCTDVAIVLLYLESLTESDSRTSAAAALSSALKRLDFASFSAAQMRRLLDLTMSLFGERERPQLVFELLQNDAFRAALDNSIESLPDALAELIVPMRAAHAAVVEGGENEHGADALARGVSLLLAAPEGLLTAHSEDVRSRLFEIGLDAAEQSKSTGKALNAILDSFAKDSRRYSQLAVVRARHLLEKHRDDEARKILEQLRKHHASFRMPARWLTALDGPRLGRIALPPDADPTEIVKGLWLDHQRPVWVVTGSPDDAQRFDAETALHEELLLPGLVPFFFSGLSDDHRPYLVFEQVGTPASATSGSGRNAGEPSRLARSGIEILSALALAGIALPDVETRRFLVDGGSLLLARLDGAERVAADEARRRHLPIGKAWVLAIFAATAKQGASPRLMRKIEGAKSLAELGAAILSAS